MSALRLITAPTAAPVTLTDVKANLAIPSGNTDNDTLLRIIRDAAVERVQSYTARALVKSTWKWWLDNWTGDNPAIYCPGGLGLIVPMGRLVSVTHVKYTDVGATQSTWSTDYYDVDTDSDPGRIMLGYGDTYPSDQLAYVNPIEIQFVAGWYNGDAWASATAYTSGRVVIPATITDALRGLAYECTTAGTSGASEPTWPTTIAGTVTDGTVTWTARERVPEAIRHAIMVMVDDAFQNRGDTNIGPGIVALNLRAAESLLSPYRIWRP